MKEINFIVLKKYQNEKSEIHVFANDGEVAIYPIFDGKKPILSSHIPLKKLAEQNGIEFSSAGLRELRNLGLFRYTEKETINSITNVLTTDKTHELISQENKNQVPYQEEKETQKIKRIVITRTKDRKADMHVFMNNGEEVVYPIYDGKNLVKSNYVQLKKLAEQNGVEFSNEGLEKLQDSRLLQYMTEEKFARVQEAISQRNKNQVHDQAEKRIVEQPIKENIHTDSVDSASKKTVSRREDNLDFSNIQEFMTHEKETPKKEEKRTSTRNSDFAPKNRVNDNGIDIPEFKNHRDDTSKKENLGNTTLKQHRVAPSVFTKKKNKLSIKEKIINYLEGLLSFIKEKKAGIVYSIISTAIVLALGIFHLHPTDKHNIKDSVSIVSDVNKKDMQKNSSNNKATMKVNTNAQVVAKKQPSNQQTTNNQEMKEANYKIMIETLKSKKVLLKKTQQEVNQTIVTPILPVTRIQGSHYKARLTNFWPNDGYGTGEKTGSGKTIHDFQVNEHGWYTYHGKLVIGTATPYLLKYGYTLGKGIRMYEYYEELTLTIDGKDYPAIVLDSCGAAMKEKRIDLFVVDERHQKNTTIRVNENVGIGKSANQAKKKVKTR